MEKEALRRFFILRMYKTKKYGVVSCRMENKILADLERGFERKKQNYQDFLFEDSDS